MAGDNYWQAAGQTCDTFLFEGKKQTVEVTIYPLKVIEENNQTKAVWGCSRWQSCGDKTCQYSMASKGPKK
jgi:hypothetical protein